MASRDPDALDVVGDATETTIMVLVLGVVFSFPAAWFIMLGLGAAHDEWVTVPALGFWAVEAMYLGLSALVGIFRKSS